MSEEILVKYASPTLAGIKTGSLFSSKCASKEEVIKQIRKLNRTLVPKGVCILPLKFCNDMVLIYVFRPKRLAEDLSEKEAEELLSKAGYTDFRYEKCLTELAKRLKSAKTFPHEIGLFLGYPPEDVCGFIQHRPCLMTGFWKVYSDAQGAEKKFRQYRKCMEVYSHRLAAGCPLEKLAVAS